MQGEDLDDWERLLAAERHRSHVVGRGRLWAQRLADRLLTEGTTE